MILKNRILNRGILLTSTCVLLLTASCKKFTELSPVSSLSEETAFTTPANIELAAIGMYSTASYGFYYANTSAANTPRGYPFGAANTIQNEMRGEDMVNLATFYQVTYESLVDATTANNVNMWNNLYALINQCNILIAGVKAAGASGTIATTVATQYEAEARFLRALAHHELVINFSRPYADGNGSKAGIPYRTVAINSSDAVNSQITLGRGTVAQDYANILADLDFAEANLPVKSTVNAITRASKGAAVALKTRIKLHMQDWAGVIAEGAKLGTGAAATTFTAPSTYGGYALTTSPDGPFVSFMNNTESMFSIENSSAANGGTNGALPSMFGAAANVISPTFGARTLVVTSPNLYNASFWVTGDTRRTLLQVQGASTGNKYFFNYKYRDPLNRTDYNPIIRYAEVLLNVAEAYSRTTALDVRALSLLNAVRNRAVPAASQFTAATFTTQNSLTQAILNERRIEFAGEGRRWPDITRLSQDPVFQVAGGGIPAKTLVTDLVGDGSQYNTTTRPVVGTSKAALPYSDVHYVWPIPAQEVSSNPTLKAQQNPGY